ncbi:alpha/beta hydrolase [Streptomyces sp. URMC 123]|uniref:alpha/beta hydrolase n=1 Tax=Streptomyces sp. URMC 123 TaxID=3423403 RepID=UPI003F1DB3A1
MNGPATAYDERPCYLDADGERLFAVVTEPVGEPSGTGVLLLSGGVYVLSTNRNRMFVTLARRLAGRGHRVLRLDYRGVGESTGVISDYALDSPNPADVSAAVACLTEAGSRRIAAVGSCFGARAALHTLAGHPALESLVLLSPPVGDAGRGEAATLDEVGPLFLDRLRTLRDRRVPTLLFYGEEDPSHRDVRMASAGPLGELLAPGSPLTVRTVPGQAHGLQRVSAQEAFTAAALDWLDRSAPAAAPGEEGVRR